MISGMTSKARRADYIPASLLKQFFSSFVPIIVHLANLSFSTRVFLSNYKNVIVAPILKKSGMKYDKPANMVKISKILR